MPVGATLADLRRDLRAETGQSLNMAQGTQSQLSQDNMLNRQQLELWDAWQWPHLRYWVDKKVSKGQAIYDFPAEMPFDQVVRIMVSDGGVGAWQMLAYGLHSFDIPSTPLLASGDPDPNWKPPSGSPCRWGTQVTVTNGKTDPIGKLLLVPTPDTDGMMRFEGQAPCNPMVDPADRCVIDSKAIVLFAAAEILAVQKVEAAAMKLTKAQAYMRKLIINTGSDKRINYNMGGRAHSLGIDHFGARPYRGYVPGIDYVP